MAGGRVASGGAGSAGAPPERSAIQRAKAARSEPRRARLASGSPYHAPADSRDRRSVAVAEIKRGIGARARSDEQRACIVAAPRLRVPAFRVRAAGVAGRDALLGVQRERLAAVASTVSADRRRAARR